MCVSVYMCVSVFKCHSVKHMVIGVDQQIKYRLTVLKAIIQYMPDSLDVGQREAGVMAWEEFLQVGKVCCRVPL